MTGKYWQTGFGELYRSLSKAAFVRALQKLLPEIRESDLVPGGAGVRAQAVSASGALVDDFVIKQGRNAIHVLNAPSPGATASLAIGRQICEMAEKNFDLKNDRSSSAAHLALSIPHHTQFISLRRLKRVAKERDVLIEVIHHRLFEGQKLIRLQIRCGDIGPGRNSAAGSDCFHSGAGQKKIIKQRRRYRRWRPCW